MEKVTALVTKEEHINQECVQILEHWLSDAKSGKIRTVVVAGETAAGWESSHSSTLNRRHTASMLMTLAMSALGFVNISDTE